MAREDDESSWEGRPDGVSGSEKKEGGKGEREDTWQKQTG